MGERTTVKVSKRYQIAVPSLVRRRLNIESGDELLINVQGSIALIMPKPTDYARGTVGLHREVWAGLDTDAYIREEREARQESPKD